MAVTALEIKERRPFAQGVSFGEVGPYEQLDGTAHFSVDPDHPVNSAITDLKLAPRDINGLVKCSKDFCILKPVMPRGGNQRILVDVVNRGRGVALRYFNSGARNPDPTTALAPGNGFLMRQGYTVVQCGWQYDLPQGAGLMRIDVPNAAGPDGPLSGKIVATFQPNTSTQILSIIDQVRRPYPSLPSNIDDPEAVLTMRDYEDASPQTIQRDQWSFARLENGHVVPDAAHIYMASGFLPGQLYQVVYSTTGAPVLGMGLLAVRDMCSFLRYGTAQEDNPCADEVQYAYGFGVSQTGRFLRLFLYLGLNLDENDRPVFDGIIPHIGGGRRGEFNRRFGQLSNLSKRTVSYLFPFNDTEQTDLKTGRTDGLLSRQVARGGVPKVFFINTSAEYWGSLASLIHTDVAGTRDAVPSEYVRIYHFSGTQHSPGGLPLDNTASDDTRMQQPCNIVDYRPLLRAALVHLDRWVTSGEAPPPSRHPRIDDGTLVPPERIAATLQAIPGVNFPAHLCPLTSQDFRPGMEEGREQGVDVTPPMEVGKAFTNLVSTVDEDGNELGGIHLPDISVPLATHTGWNLLHPETGRPNQIIGLTGSSIPFPATRVGRKTSGDPRLSIEERYASKEDYLEQVKKAAQELVDEGYLLAVDLKTVLEQAAQRYDMLRNPLK